MESKMLFSRKKPLGFFGKVLFFTRLFLQLEVCRGSANELFISHPKGVSLDYLPRGADNNVVPELYLQYTGALLQSSVVLSLQHDGHRPWQNPASLATLVKNEKTPCLSCTT